MIKIPDKSHIRVNTVFHSDTYQVGDNKSKTMNFKVWLALNANTRPLSVPRINRPETEISFQNLFDEKPKNEIPKTT